MLRSAKRTPVTQPRGAQSRTTYGKTPQGCDASAADGETQGWPHACTPGRRTAHSEQSSAPSSRIKSPFPSCWGVTVRWCNVEERLWQRAAAVGGEPRFMSPYFPSLDGDISREALPLMIYVPGIDGVGYAAHGQLERLAAGFQLETFMIPFEDKHDFQSLLQIFTARPHRSSLQTAIAFCAGLRARDGRSADSRTNGLSAGRVFRGRPDVGSRLRVRRRGGSRGTGQSGDGLRSVGHLNRGTAASERPRSDVSSRVRPDGTADRQSIQHPVRRLQKRHAICSTAIGSHRGTSRAVSEGWTTALRACVRAERSADAGNAGLGVEHRDERHHQLEAQCLATGSGAHRTLSPQSEASALRFSDL